MTVSHENKQISDILACQILQVRYSRNVGHRKATRVGIPLLAWSISEQWSASILDKELISILQKPHQKKKKKKKKKKKDS